LNNLGSLADVPKGLKYMEEGKVKHTKLVYFVQAA